MSKVALRTLDALEKKIGQEKHLLDKLKSRTKDNIDSLDYTSQSFALQKVIVFINELREGLQKD